jgi:hypothetical protein
MPSSKLTFDPAFGRLGREIERFANHTQKLVEASQKHRRTLERASAWSEGAAPLDRRPESPTVAMNAIDRFARIHREGRATLFGAYFAHHHLRLQAEMSRDLIRAASKEPEERAQGLGHIHARAEADRRAWVSALLEASLRVACPELGPDEYVAFNVGALTDHEDVDLAIIATSMKARQQIDRGFSAVSKTFLRFASKIQLFLAEQVPGSRTGSLIEEYEDFAAGAPKSVVPVMQLLGAQRLAGSEELAVSFRERITERYYAQGGDPRAHEGFLRAVSTELAHYRTHQRLGEILAPKREVYRPSKLITTAMRTVHRVHDPYPPGALLELARIDPPRAPAYVALKEAFVEAEILRGLLFLYVVKDDEIDLYDPAIRPAARRVAIVFGLGASKRRSAELRLPEAYHDLRAQAVGSILELEHDLRARITSGPSFRLIVEATKSIAASEDNAMMRFLDTLERIEIESYRAEAVVLASQDRALAARLWRDLSRLSLGARASIAKRAVKLLVQDPAALIELLVLLGTFSLEGFPEERLEAEEIVGHFWSALFDVFEDDAPILSTFVDRLAAVGSEAMQRLATSHAPQRLAALADLIEARPPSARGIAVVRSLRSMILLVHHHSNALGRMSSRVMARTPELVERLPDLEQIRALAGELRMQAARAREPAAKIQLLGDAFDVLSLKCAIAAVLEGGSGDRDREWTEAFDAYVKDLFFACAPELGPEHPEAGLAIFATGGVGRTEAFAADWDYLAVISDPSLAPVLSGIVQRLEGALVRRGVVPHNRLTQRFNSYAVSLRALRGHLEAREADTFIDEAEMLEARFMFGDLALKEAFESQVVRFVVEHSGTAFVRDLLDELSELRRGLPNGLSIKEGPGGLREINLLSLVLRVVAKGAPTDRLPEVLPDQRADLRFLTVARSELRRIRDLYRLVVALDEPIDPEAMVQIARDLKPLRDAGARGELEAEIRKLMQASAARVDAIASRLATIN